MEAIVGQFDWQRMFFGNDSPSFLVEILIRTTIIYIYTLILLRWLGSRTIGQLSTIEFLLVIALGSAVGDAMFYPEVPLLHALAVITLVVGANKGLDSVIGRSERAERVIDGSPIEVIRDGVISLEFINGTILSQSELFQQLREQGVEHLGQVGLAYLETNGHVTVFKASEEKPGLPIIPPWEITPPVEMQPSKSSRAQAVCKQCGLPGKIASNSCSHCHHDIWVRAYEGRQY